MRVRVVLFYPLFFAAWILLKKAQTCEGSGVCVCVAHLGRFLLALLLEGCCGMCFTVMYNYAGEWSGGFCQLAVAWTVKVPSVPFRGEHFVKWKFRKFSQIPKIVNFNSCKRFPLYGTRNVHVYVQYFQGTDSHALPVAVAIQGSSKVCSSNRSLTPIQTIQYTGGYCVMRFIAGNYL